MEIGSDGYIFSLSPHAAHTPTHSRQNQIAQTCCFTHSPSPPLLRASRADPSADELAVEMGGRRFDLGARVAPRPRAHLLRRARTGEALSPSHAHALALALARELAHARLRVGACSSACALASSVAP
eukprot:3294113-Pleurochrysis_carterae.AAC.2